MKRNNNKVSASKKKLIIALIAVSFVILFGGYIYYIAEEREIKEEKHQILEAIAHQKVEQLCNWLEERKGDAQFLARSPLARKALKAFLNEPENLAIRDEIKQRLKLTIETYKYEEIILIDKNKNVLLTTDHHDERFSDYLQSKIDEAFLIKNTLLSDFYYCSIHNKIHFDIIQPVLDEQGNANVIYLLRVAPEKFLYPLIQSWPTPSKTSETLLVRKEGDSVLFLNALKFYPNAAFHLTKPLSDTTIPAVKAVLGHHGIFEGKDYRGVDVLADLQPIPNTPWFMVSKVDEVEIYRDLRQRTLGIVLFTIILIIAVSAIITFFYVNRQRSILGNLLKKERALNLIQEEYKTILYSIGDAVITTDTEGKIKQMNSVAEELTGWDEKEATGKDIFIVFNIINEETREIAQNPVERVIKEGIVVGLANHTVLISRDGKEIPISDSGAPIKDEKGNITGVVLIFRDQTKERLAQKIIDVRLHLFEYSQDHTISELLTKTLDEVEELTGSTIGFYHFVEQDQETLTLQAWSTRTSQVFCKSEGAGLHYKISEAGVWVDCVNKRAPVIHNDYFSLPHKKGMPEGHAEVTRELVVPVIKDEKIVAIMGVGNKKIDYNEQDVSIASYIADVVWVIIEEKRKQEEIAKEREKFNKYLDLIESIVVVINKEQKIELLNRKGYQILGYDYGTLIGKNWFDCCLPEKVSEELKNVFYQILNGEVEAFEYHENEVITKTKEERLIAWHNTILKNDDGKIIGTLSAGEDITERKKAEDALRISEEKFRKIFESSNAGKSVTSIDGKINPNEAFCEMLGYTLEELQYKKWQEITYPEDIEANYKALEPLLEGEKDSTRFIKRYLHKNGSIVWADVSTTLIRDGNNKPSYYITTLVDITERVKYEEENKLNQERIKVQLELSMMKDASLKEITDFTLEESIKITNSEIGYLAFLNEDETILTMYSWSVEAMKQCAIKEKLIVNKIDEIGLWGEAVRQRRAIITNDYTAPNPFKKGYPEGHINVIRHLNVPIFDGNKIVALIGVGNKKQEYNDSDIKQLQLLAQTMWTVIKRLKDEKELREKERIYRHLISNLPGFVYRCANDRDWTMFFISEQCKEITGYSPDEFINNRVLAFNDIIHPDYQETLWQKWQKVLAEKSYFQDEYPIITSDNEIRWVWERGGGVYDENGNLLYLEGFIMDITDSKKAEQEKKKYLEETIKSKQEIESLYEGAKTILESPDFNSAANVLVDLAMQMTGATSGYIALTNEDESENYIIISKSPGLECNVDQTLPMPIRGLRSEVYKSRKVQYENDFMNSPNVKYLPEGHIYTRNILFAPILIKGKNVGIVGLANKPEDFDEDDARISMAIGGLAALSLQNWQTFDALKEIQELNTSFINTHNDLIFVKDEQFRYIIVNDALADFFGTSKENILNKTDYELMDEEYANSCKDSDLKALELNDLYTTTELIEDRTYEVTKFPIKLRDNKVGLGGIIRDITEKRQAEIDLIRAKQKAEESDRLKSAFLANMSHEIRTPLNGIMGFTELLDDNSLSKEERKTFLNTIKNSGYRLMNIVNDVISMAKIETGQIVARYDSFSINHLISDLYNTFEQKVLDRGLKLKYEIDFNMEESFIISDEQKIYQIYSNLISNAIKFTNEGSIVFGYKKSDNELLCYVKDTGIGIAKENHNIIFERFRQAESTLKRKFEGAGLGLAIAKGFVNLLGGRIWVESEEGKGSTFYFALPLKKGNSDSIKEQKSIQPVDSGGFTILVAEDENTNFQYINHVIKKFFNANIIRAVDGEDTLEKFRTHPEISLILLDIKMPLKDGYEVFQEIRKEIKNIPIIAITAYAMNEDREKALKMGFNSYLSKPFNSSQLVELISKFM